ncbi:MAG: type I-U CRISPR-associated helicase/endonuclease Cas3 [Candidatus Competibacteraceae bacterium]
MMAIVRFQKLFETLTGNDPFPWQTELARRLLNVDIPAGCNLPTGTGKTSVIPIWVICLGLQTLSGRVTLPRRLIYAVNRRVIVDQASEEVNRLIAALSHHATEPQVIALRAALETLAATTSGFPIAVSTLRGGLADNGEWKVDPAKPAIVIGTVDMIGSRLLFCGYGDGRRDRPLHAGLLGQDALLVHDESHLMPAFGQSLRHVRTLGRRGIALRPFYSLDLSATRTDGGDNPFGLGADDYDCPSIRRRLGLDDQTGRKRLAVHRLPKSQQLVEHFAQLACWYEGTGASVLIYVRTVALARKIHDALRKTLADRADKGENRLAILTGTLRGYERDRLTEHPALQRFSPARDREVSSGGTVYLISTAAGEVGANYDADNCVCDLTTLENMVQRFGRVNRVGLFPESAIDVVVDEEALRKEQEGDSGKPKPLTRTLELLESLDGDASVVRVSQIAGYREACQPPPVLLDLDEWILDAWSVTGLRTADFPQRPDVALWLHGLTEAERPETQVAWRFELDSMQSLDGVEAAAWLQDYLDLLPLRRHELLKEPTREVRKALVEIGRNGAEQGRVWKAILITADGEIVLDVVAELAGRPRALEWGTVILPVASGGLAAGLLDTSQKALRTAALDVADQAGQRERVLVVRQGEDWLWRQADGVTGTVDAPSLREVAGVLATARHYPAQAALAFPITDPDAEEAEIRQAIVVLSQPETALPAAGDLSAYAKRAQPLAVHLDRVEEAARRIVAKLDLPASLAEAVCLAARWHDKGKDRRHWQKAIGNLEGEPLAKSGRARFDRRFTKGYRHEFGSLLDAKIDPVISQHPERDLILHLIAAHHGYARPGFPERAYDRTVAFGRNEAAARSVLTRFAELQNRFGWWQLAWLETLVKAADAMGGPSD